MCAHVCVCGEGMYVVTVECGKFFPGADNPSIELCSQIIQRYETTAEGKEQVTNIIINNWTKI